MMCKVLIFSCISAVVLMTAAYGAPLSTEKERLLKALIRDLEFLEEIKNNTQLELYTPSEKQECSWQTLQCYWTEMGTLENEIEDKDVANLQNIKKNLKSLMVGNLFTQVKKKEKKKKSVSVLVKNNARISVFMPQGTGCKICEENKQKEFPEFHQDLSNFLKSMLK
ncbi:hypothetical protein N338_04810 [Podiceps cristatus]|uniref:Interleukin n=1 Tax=Podiceps cristatus TaxID=345573 RepID=A0A094L8M6_PODCR|nr:hypothetical protein N338_04810 [Podiceps cristatus]